MQQMMIASAGVFQEIDNVDGNVHEGLKKW